MTKIFKTIIISAVVAVTSVSCVDNLFDKGDEKKYLSSVGDIIRSKDKNGFDIVLDTKDTMKTTNTADLDKEKYKAGTRLIFTALIDKFTKSDGNIIVYTGEIKSTKIIPVKNILMSSYVQSSEKRIDSVGNDPLYLSYIDVSGKYLNTQFNIQQEDGAIKHNISYVYDEEKSTPSHMVLHMYHNLNGDTPMDYYSYNMSCDIQKYLVGDNVEIDVYYDEKKAKDQHLSYIWRKEK